MAVEMWVTVEKKNCELIGKDVELQERRVYPSQMMPDLIAYQIMARKCTAGCDCNLAGIPCRWAYNNPELDRFHLC